MVGSRRAMNIVRCSKAVRLLLRGQCRQLEDGRTVVRWTGFQAQSFALRVAFLVSGIGTADVTER
jgi:hypothetical protein